MSARNAPTRGGQFRDQVRDARWYKKNIPVRFGQLVDTLVSTSAQHFDPGLDRDSAEVVAVRILKWQEGPVAKAYFGMGMGTNAELHKA